MTDPFKKKRNWLMNLSAKRNKQQDTFVPTVHKRNGIQLTCKGCTASVSLTTWHKNLCVCPKCGGHQGISAYERLYALLDSGTFKELPAPDVGEDPLQFPEYAAKKSSISRETGLKDAVVCAEGSLDGNNIVLVVLDSRFLMGSMGCYVGEAVTQAVEHAGEHKLPLVIFSASGGARMQEGIFSLLQMAKTSAAIARFSDKGGLYISYLTHPTTGGVSASFAALGDITLAEPGALIGFAGPRVIEQTIRQKLPEGFQRAEYLVAHGFVDCVVPRHKARGVLAQLVKLHTKGEEALAARTGS